MGWRHGEGMNCPGQSSSQGVRVPEPHEESPGPTSHLGELAQGKMQTSFRHDGSTRDILA